MRRTLPDVRGRATARTVRALRSYCSVTGHGWHGPGSPTEGQNQRPAARSPRPRRGGVRTLTVCAAAAALAAGPLGTARATGTDDTVKVTYRGHEFTVPASWPIVDLEKHPDGPRPLRPARRVPRHARRPAAVSGGGEGTHRGVPDPAVRRQGPHRQREPHGRHVPGHRRPDRRDRRVREGPYEDPGDPRDAGLPDAAAGTHVTAGAPAAAPLPADATSFRGEGFDACTAPGQTAMDAWRDDSDRPGPSASTSAGSTVPAPRAGSPPAGCGRSTRTAGGSSRCTSAASPLPTGAAAKAAARRSPTPCRRAPRPPTTPSSRPPRWASPRAR